MSFEQTIEGLAAIGMIIVFMTMVIPALVKATGVEIPFIGFSLLLLIVGIIFAIIKSWVE